MRTLTTTAELCGVGSPSERFSPRRSQVRAAGTDNQTATSNFGHSCAGVPKSLRIGAYPRVLLIGAVCRANAKPLQAATFEARCPRRSL